MQTKRQARTYSPAFKSEALALIKEQGYSVTEASSALNVGETALRRWAKQLQQERHGVTPKAAAITNDQRRIQELEQRIYRIEREKEILKKAIALLTPDVHKPSA